MSIREGQRASSPPPRTRPAAKVLLLDEHDRVLLFRGLDHAQPGHHCWFPPGGGLDEGETPQQAARREVYEETGLILDQLGPIIHHRTARYNIDGTDVIGEEDYFLTHVTQFQPSRLCWTPAEQAYIHTHRWWPVADLATTGQTMYPPNIPQLIASSSTP